MPGFVGIVSPMPASERQLLVNRMVESMLHEPSYRHGTFGIDELGFTAGWICHANSYSDCQPLISHRGEYGLVFAGEHFPPLPSTVSASAYLNAEQSPDARELLAIYTGETTSFIRNLNGTFSGLLWDKRFNRIVLFNDRFGLSRVYWFRDAAGFYFASEAKAILTVRPELRRADLRGLGELMVCGCTMQDRSLFPDIHLLPASSAWSIERDGSFHKANYFDRAEWENTTQLSSEEYYEALKACITTTLPRYFRARVPMGLSITGGLDSRLVIAGAMMTSRTIPCYTFGGSYRESEDVRLGRLVANLCGQNHQVLTVDKHILPRFSSLAEKCIYVTDGAMDVTGAIGLFVNGLARNIAPLRMTGNYGSEILRQHVAFKGKMPSAAPYAASLASQFLPALETYRSERANCKALTFIAFKQVPWHHYARLAEEQSQLIIRAPYLDHDIVSLAYRAPSGQLLNKHLIYRLIRDLAPALAHAPTDRGRLHKPPLLPSSIYERLLEIPPRLEYYFDYGMPHWLAKLDTLIAPLCLERHFLGQQKYYHFRTWYRNALAPQIRDILLDSRSLGRPYISRRAVEKLVTSHIRGLANHTTAIHKLLTLELFHRCFIDLA